MKNIIGNLLAAISLAGLAQLSALNAATLPVGTEGITAVATGSGLSSYGGDIGDVFTLDQTSVLSQLGIYYTPDASFGASQSVSLYSTTSAGQTLLATATVTFDTAAGTTAGFEYSPILTAADYSNGFDGILISGDEYLISTVGTDYYYGVATGAGAQISTAAGVNLISGAVNDAPSTDNRGYTGPNFTFVAAPEPSTTALMLGGLALLLVGQRLRRKV
jgi:hypothetical protein